MKQKLHILFLCGWYPSRVLPTNGDFIQRHAEAVATKHRVSVLHIISDETVSKTEYDIFKKNDVETHIAYVKKTKKSIFKVKSFYNAYNVLLKRIGNFDVVHVNELYPFGMFALHLKWFKKQPYIISEHFTGYLKPKSSSIGFPQKFLSNIITRNAVFVCPVSQNLAKNMESLGFNGNYKSVPNVVDTTLFFPAKEENDAFNILHISNMNDEHKNVSGLLNVVREFQKNNNISITLIGENSNKYSNKAIELGIKNIEFVDQIEQKKLNTYFAKADVFILFSNIENLPCVILESFSTGTPVLATNVGGISEYFPSNFGFLIEKENEDKLLKALKNTYEQKHQFATTEKMHNYVKNNFSKEKIASQFSELYYSVLKKK